MPGSPGRTVMEALDMTELHFSPEEVSEVLGISCASIARSLQRAKHFDLAREFLVADQKVRERRRVAA